MKKIVTLSFALMLCASAAMAQVNLYVGDCGANSTTTSVTNTCTLNTGTAFIAFGSVVVPPVTRIGFVGAQSVVDIQSSSATLPDWWRADACRSAGFSISADGAMGGSCPTLWDAVPPAGSNLTGQYGLHGANSERLLLGTVLASTDAYDLQGDGTTELSVFKLTVLRTKTLSATACTGCATGACIVLNEVNLQTLTDSPDTFLRLTTPIANSYLTYNAGAPPCPGSTPTQSRTWGSVKALYR
jgi:hypothetical protein